MSIDPSRTVAELVLERPARARALEELGLDYCCGGKRSLTEACASRGVDQATALAALEAVTGPAPEGEADWTEAPLAELCDHIANVHHARTRTELPRLSGLIATILRVHGDVRPELEQVQATFTGLRSELEEHMTAEEERLFPLCRSGAELDAGAVALLEDEHQAAGDALEELRALTDGFDVAQALCNTHRATLDGLRELELELHQHIHEENNVLFPRVLGRLPGAAVA
jgi:regulator of cell morphogenesis and NO signaling